MRANAVVVALSVAASLGLPALGHEAAAQYTCNPAYLPASDGSCVPYVGDGDLLNCVDIGYREYYLPDVYNDPYGLDDWDGPGNGVTCDSYN